MAPLALDPSLGTPVVYLVDDEEVVRDALAMRLRSRRTWPAAPACLLLKMRMPGTNGLVLLEQMNVRSAVALANLLRDAGPGS